MKRRLSGVPLSTLLLTLFVCLSVFAQTTLFQGRVVNVSSGDTVTVLTQSNTPFQVRCRGINAPKGEEEFASHARRRLAALLDEAVTVRYAQRDSDGTIAGTIVWNGRDVCLDQVAAGLARYDDQSEQSRSARQQYADAESGARTNRFGLWSVATLDADKSSPESTSETSTSNSVADQRKLEGAGSDTSSNATVNVSGYFRKNGTYVAGHKRTAPDGNFNNNWSTQGNVNPYTGQVGTKKRSRWLTTLKWVGIGAALGGLIYLDAKYPTATARCNDGTYSYSKHRQGTCSHHGGVAYWLR